MKDEDNAELQSLQEQIGDLHNKVEGLEQELEGATAQKKDYLAQLEKDGEF